MSSSVVLLTYVDAQACELVNKYMEELASSWVYVKFIRLRASLCGVNVAANKLPILSVYR
jgi:hypothetical protein